MSTHLQSIALEQGTEPINAHIGPWDELVTHPGDPPFVDPPCDPKRVNVGEDETFDHYIFVVDAK